MENHEMEDVTLYACKNCLTETEYGGYDEKVQPKLRTSITESFDIKFLMDMKEHSPHGNFTVLNKPIKTSLLISTLLIFLNSQDLLKICILAMFKMQS